MTAAKNVGLEVFEPQRDMPVLNRWLRSADVIRWWGVHDPTTIAGRSKDSQAFITANGRPVGYMCWQEPSSDELEAATLSDLPENLVDIDILIGEPEFRGQGIGPVALVLLVAKLRDKGHAFAGVGTSISNRPAIRAFEKAGFGLFRDFEDPGFGPSRYMMADLRD